MKTHGAVEWIGLEETLHCSYYFNFNMWDDDEFLYIQVDRYACDENGYHEGYEKYIARFRIFDRMSLQTGAIKDIAEKCIFLDMYDIEIIPARGPWTDVDVEEALLANNIRIPPDADLWELAEEHDIYDPYYPPDEMFAYEELNHHLSQLWDKVRNHEWVFDPQIYSSNKWHLKEKGK